MAAMATRDGDGGATELPHRKMQKKGRIRGGKKARLGRDAYKDTKQE